VIAFPSSARGKRKRVDTIVLDAKTMATLKNPSFQRPFKHTAAVSQVVEVIRQTGVFPGILTIGVYQDKLWVIDGQHRLEGVRLSERGDVLADVHYVECDSVEEMAEEFRQLNSALVKFSPDDLLRAKEVQSPSLQRLRARCKFIGYDHVRHNDTTSPILSMSQVIRAWFGSEPDVPSVHGSASSLADRLTLDDAVELANFLNMAFEAWGRDKVYARLWSQLNLTLVLWVYRRSVLAPPQKVQRRTHLTREQFGKCMHALSADGGYLDYLLGRKFNDDHRGPTYARIKQVFVRRLRDEGISNALFPNASWGSR
jgi:hypothetical protein